MKILVINNNVMVEKVDGRLYIHNSYAPFLEELAQLNDEVLFYQHRLKIDDDAPLMDYCVNDRSYKIRPLKRRRFKIMSYLYAYLYGIYLITKCDALYIFYPNNFKFLAFFAKLLEKKFGLYVRGQMGINSKISQILYRKADIVLTVSPGFTKVVENFGGKADTIRPMISISDGDIVRDREYKIKSHYKILFLGRIEFDKGLRELMTAVRMLVDNGISNFHLDMVGDGNHLQEIQKLCKNLGVNEFVTFCGNQSKKEKIKHCFVHADIYILPTYHEGFPRTLYEAMTFGTPIITTLVGGIPYLMKDRENCFAIEPQSIESIYETLSLVLNDYEQMIPIANNGTKTISDYFVTHPLSHAKQLTKYLRDDK